MSAVDRMSYRGREQSRDDQRERHRHHGRRPRPAEFDLHRQREDREGIEEGAPRHELKRRERPLRSEEHTSELQSLMRISYAVFCLKKKTNKQKTITIDSRETKHTNKHTKHTVKYTNMQEAQDD